MDQEMTGKAPKAMTGQHVLFIFVAAFGIIIGVNILLAVSAVKTFPGLEVKNSYVASQQFNERKAAQLALGWTVEASHRDGMLHLSFRDQAGAPVRVKDLQAVVGRATHMNDDLTPVFAFDGLDFVAPMVLADGNWNVRLTAWADDGTEFSQRVILHVFR